MIECLAALGESGNGIVITFEPLYLLSSGLSARIKFGHMKWRSKL